MELLVLCGAPGSGKTTLSKEIANKYSLVRYSMDEMKLFRHSELIPYIVKSLQDGKDIVVDALYIKIAWRKELLEAIKEIECKKTLIYMDIPINECIRRNTERKGDLPNFIVEDIYKSIEKPSLIEGWDNIKGVSL